MNRNEEYQALLAELEQTPPELETVVQRAEARAKSARKRRRIWGIPAGTLAACFVLFVLLVNLMPTFAYACGGVPVLRELAKAVAWSPSLSAAVENQYVQPIGQSQTKNGITATVEYLIVDQKQVNIFFTLEGDYATLSAEMPEFTPRQSCAILGSGSYSQPGELLKFTLDYVDNDVPDSLTMTFAVTGEREGEESGRVPEDSGKDYADEMLEGVPRPERETLAEFTFTLKFDPQYTARGELVPVNQRFTLDGQTLTITEAEIYPTHVRINLSGVEDNSAWLKDLEFYLEDENGQRFDSITNGVSATGDPETPAMVSFRLESPYFIRSKHLTLSITGARWLEKEHERVEIDLKNQTAPWLPEGVSLKSAELRESGWILHFTVNNGIHTSPFSMTFYGPDGTAYEMGSQGFTVGGEEDAAFSMLPLPDYLEDRVWLEAAYSHSTQEDSPVVIPIK